MPKLEPVKVALVHCNLVNNNYYQRSKIFFTFVSNKQFGLLITIAAHSITMWNRSNTNFNPLKYGLLIKIVNLLKLNLMLVWKYTNIKYRKYDKGYVFCHLHENLEINMVKN